MKCNFDGQKAPRSFTKLILSVIKILSGILHYGYYLWINFFFVILHFFFGNENFEILAQKNSCFIWKSAVLINHLVFLGICLLRSSLGSSVDGKTCTNSNETSNPSDGKGTSRLDTTQSISECPPSLIPFLFKAWREGHNSWKFALVHLKIEHKTQLGFW